MRAAFVALLAAVHVWWAYADVCEPMPGHPTRPRFTPSIDYQRQLHDIEDQLRGELQHHRFGFIIGAHKSGVYTGGVSRCRVVGPCEWSYIACWTYSIITLISSFILPCLL